ncbi:carboxypeptidase N subunit 2-like [Zophobas morio]|uniref:carboxypeptidase N subunit 2-like n=1 Tax=Zophobas morio TaxID=2755281 RepID=UPI003083DECB
MLTPIIFVVLCSPISGNLIKYEVTFLDPELKENLSGNVISVDNNIFKVTVLENLPELRNGMLNITDLHYLTVNNVNLQYMETGVFDNQNISHISIAGNKLTKIQSRIFDSLSTETLNLSENQIDFIEEGAFRNMLKLCHLILSRNKLTRISSSYFDNTPNIIVFDISFNQITKIEEGCFSFLAEDYLIITIGNNAVEEIHPRGFENLNITELVLSHNLIRNVPEELVTRNKITILQLDYNQIRDFPDTFYAEMNSTIEALMISFNPLKCQVVEKIMEFSEKVIGPFCFSDEDCFETCQEN